MSKECINAFLATSVAFDQAMVTLASEWATMIWVPDGRPKELDVVTTRSKPFTEAEAPVEVMVIVCSFTMT